MTRLVVGGSDAGISAGLRARQVDPSAEPLLIVGDAFPNFSICGIPCHISGDVADWRDLAHRRYEDWVLDDPAGMTVEDVRPIRDEIERRVRGLLSELGVPVQR
jgi:NADPH-dependent 2,4-dienoyl-CoA reductase/sulfur reductase-like enzyme